MASAVVRVAVSGVLDSIRVTWRVTGARATLGQATCQAGCSVDMTGLSAGTSYTIQGTPLCGDTEGVTTTLESKIARHMTFIIKQASSTHSLATGS